MSSETRRSAEAPRAKGPISLDGTISNWPGVPPNLIPGSRLTLGGSAEGLEGSFRLCWDDTHPYIMVQVKDPTPLRNENAPEKLWSADGIEVFLGTEKPDEGGPLQFLDRQVLVGAPGVGIAPFYYGNSDVQYACAARVFVSPAGYTVEAAIPWTALGGTPRLAQILRFDLAIDDSTDGRNRRAQIIWSARTTRATAPGGERSTCCLDIQSGLVAAGSVLTYLVSSYPV